MLDTTDILRIPRIKDLKDLAFQTKLSIGLLYKMVNIPDKFYIQIEIDKKNGRKRKIECPSKKMKAIQAWILRNVLDKIDVNPSAKAFRRRMNLSSNVKPHDNNNYFLCLDFKDFFCSINFGSIYNIFSVLGYDDSMCFILTRLCSYNGRLPQGGVTSPTLSNIACIKLDERLSNYLGIRDIVYTRYADDITLSAKQPDKLLKALPTVKQIIEEEGYTLNNDKTRILGPKLQRKITGLIYDGSKFGIGREKKRTLRSAIYNYVYGRDEEDERERKFQWINGWMNYLKSVDKNSYNILKNYWIQLSCKAEVAVTNENTFD
ncbi:retron St85 family RNA-directed DNA polymerase [Clostridium chromiireducens]|uniref:RNA-directed DNA polymerase n=1 Tax=Clostridium chromiireducens TaxID=225345 RepID=A0A1V4I661_9CLOT|nr:retron St85 family RNA-directed DNA polymerase [Clostridium chromiireducens]OPJ55472.1 reverse transcriptase [Clostridium chromiireducens]